MPSLGHLVATMIKQVLLGQKVVVMCYMGINISGNFYKSRVGAIKVGHPTRQSEARLPWTTSGYMMGSCHTMTGKSRWCFLLPSKLT